MKCYTLICVCLLVSSVQYSASFKILKKIKDFLHPTTTTSTTTVTPILPNFESHEDPSYNETTPELPRGENDKMHIGDIGTSENPQGAYPDYNQYIGEKLGPDNPSSSADGSKRNFSRPTEFTNTSPSEYRPVYPGMPTTILPTDYSSLSEYEAVYPGMTTTTLPTDYTSLSEHEAVYPGMKTTTLSTVYTSSGTTKTNQHIGGHVETTSTEATRDNIHSSQLPSHQQKSTTPTYGLGNEKTTTTQGNNGQRPTTPNKDHDDGGPIVYPDHPSLNPTPEPTRAFEVGDMRTLNQDSTNVPRAPKKAHVPVGDDGGRRIINAPSKDCGSGKRADENGDCRAIARK